MPEKKHSLRSQSPSKRRSLVPTPPEHQTPPTPSQASPRILPKPLKKSLSGSSKHEFSAPIPVLEPSAPYQISPQSDNTNNSNFSPDIDATQSNRQTSSGSGNDIKQAPTQPAINVKVVAIGDGNTGKTCLLVTYANGTFPETYVPTVFENYLTKVKGPNGKMIELALWDTAGQEEYDRLRALSYPEVNVLLVCFAIDAPTSLNNVYDKWIPEITHYCPDIPFILVGLKTDLRNDMTSLQHLKSKGQRPITAEEGKRAGQRCGAFKYMECSAKNREGISEIFNQAISIVVHDKGSRKVSSANAARELPRPPVAKLVDNIDNGPRNASNSGTSQDHNAVTTKRRRKRSRCVIV